MTAASLARTVNAPIGRALLVVGVLLAGLLPMAMSGQLLSDKAAYTGAAERLLAGETPYNAASPIDPTAYRYAPWFALLWVPLTFLPAPLLEGLWLSVLLLCAGWLLYRAPAWMVVLVGPFVGWGVAVGNVAALLLFLIAVAIPTRWIALAIGIAASLKAFPILFIIPLVRTGRWREALVAVGVTLILVAPMLLFDLSGYTTSPEGPRSLYNLHPALWALGAVVGLALAVWKPSWRTGAIAVILASPRFLLYDLGWLLVQPPESPAHRRAGSTAVPSSWR